MAHAADEQLLKAMVDWETDPALDQFTIDALMAHASMADAWGNSPRNVVEATTLWSAGTVEAGTTVRTSAGRYWVAITPGTTGGTEPTWPALTSDLSGTTRVTDGSVVWLDAGKQWAGSFGLDAAAAMGWRIKAGKAATRFGFMTDGQQFSRQQVHAMCLAMAQTYERRCAKTITLTRGA